MKYMNHLRKLALLSSLALSFTVYADGTLPLPGTSLPLTLVSDLNGSLTEAAPADVTVSITTIASASSTPNIPGFSNPCTASNPFYKSTGSTSVGDNDFDAIGVCIPLSKTDKRRVVVATDGSTLVLLDGTAQTTGSGTTEKLTRFKGTLTVKGPGLGAGATATFNLIPTN